VRRWLLAASLAAALLVAGCGGHTTRRFGGIGPCVQEPSGALSCRGLDSVTAPFITGTPVQGNVLTASVGTWNTPPDAYSYEWLDCNSNGQNCTPITGATSVAYTLQASDVGDTIQVWVTGSKGTQTTTAYSGVTGVVSGGTGAPVNSVAPYFTASTGNTSCIAGCAIQGQSLSVTTGTWSNTPTSYSYQWKDCTTTSGQPPTTGSCVNATGTGATTATYTVSASDLGKSLVPIVTATNGSGSTSTTVAGSCDTGEIPFVNPADAYNDPARLALSGPIVAGVGCSPISAKVATTQAGELFCTNAPTTCGYGDPLAGTVGVPPGTSLTSISSLTLSSSGCSGLGNPAWCSGAGTSGSPFTINAVQTPGVQVNGGIWQIQNSEILFSGGSMCKTTSMICTASGSTLTLLNSTVNGADNGTNQANIAVNSESGGTVTQNGVYVYNAQRIMQGLGTVQNSFCDENASQAGSHLECWFSAAAGTHQSTNDVFYEPWNQTAVFDGGGTGQALNSNGDLFIGTGFDFYMCTPTDNPPTIVNGRFSRYDWTTSGFNGILYTGCTEPTPASWTGNIWDDTGATVLYTQTGS
jgi:hypothetical protein